MWKYQSEKYIYDIIPDMQNYEKGKTIGKIKASVTSMAEW